MESRGVPAYGSPVYDAAQWHVWTMLYRKDNTYSASVDGIEVQSGTISWTNGGGPGGEAIDMSFIFDGTWGSRTVTSTNHTLAASALAGKYYEWDYSRVYRRTHPVLDSEGTAGVVKTPADGWTSSTGETGYGGANFFHDDNTGKGTKSVSYTPTLSESGTYQVFLRWTVANAGHSTNTPVDILKADGTTATVTVNQQLDGSGWVSLGTYTLSKSNATVTIRTTGTNGYVIADGVRFTPVARDIIVDNAPATRSGTWTRSISVTGYQGVNYIHDGNAGKGSKTVRFTPTIDVTGTYQVYAKWSAGADRASNAPYTITYAGGLTATVSMNQQLNGGAWVLLGTYPFDAGTPGNVLLSNAGTSGYVIADAVKFTNVASIIAPPTVTVTPPGTSTGSSPITFTLTFSRPVTGLAASGITVTNGVKGTLAGSGTTYTIPVTPSAQGAVTCQVNAGAAQDTATNGNTASNTASVIYDSVTPTATISAPSLATTAVGPVTYTVTYTDANFSASTLAAADIALGKTGTADGVVAVAGTGTTRTVTVSGITGNGTLGISLAAGTATDTAGNSAAAAGPSASFTVTNDVTLSNLVLSAGTLTPAFGGGTTSYTASVANGTNTIKLTPTVADSGATVKVNGVTVVSGTASASISLVVGANTITTVVTAQDGTTTKTYTIVVTRAGSSNANLSSLLLSAGTLTPVFASGTMSYSASVPNTTTSITVTPTVTQPSATVKVNGTTVASGTASLPISLNVGSNTINTVVTAQNGTTTKTYKVVVSRAGATNADLIALSPSTGTLSPAFISTTLSYTQSFNNSTLSIRLTPVLADPAATVKVNGTTVPSGTASSSIPLYVGSNVINTVVTAQDGVTTRTYKDTVTVTVNPSVAGYYTGLATPTSASTNPPRQVGLLAISVLSTGPYTGKITLGGSSTAIAFSGTLVNNTATQDIVRAGLPTLIMTLTASGDAMTGSLTEGATSVSTVALNKLLYTSTVPPPAPLMNVPLSVRNPAAENGSYTGIFRALTPAQQGLAATAFPQGSGWMTLKVNPSGSVTATGKLGDGQTVSYTNYLSKGNVLPFFISPYSGTGTVSGLVSFRDTPGQSDVDGIGLVWFKVAKSNDTSYRSGWPNGIKVDLIGSKFIAPSLANVNAQITLSDGNLVSTLTNHLSVNASSQVTVLDPATGAPSLVMTLAATGSFSGSFVHPVSNKSTAIGGVVLQKTQNGSGYFMGLPATGNVSQSGAVTLQVQ